MTINGETHKRLESVAIHEAGHVVVARSLGAMVAGVSLQPDSARCGWVAITPLSTNNVERCRQALTIFCGGAVAEELRAGEPVQVLHQDESDCWRVARTLLGMMATEEAIQQEIHAARERARVILTLRWSAVERLAAALLAVQLAAQELDHLDPCDGEAEQADAVQVNVERLVGSLKVLPSLTKANAVRKPTLTQA
jgi:hypothetical protein